MKGWAAGVVAAATWAAAEPALRRVARTPYSDVRMLGRLATRGRAWPLAGLTLHLANGAVFGATFERLGFRGARAGIAAAELENLVLWPTLKVVERFHPDRRSGAWPSLHDNRRVAAYEVATHALFGATLGALISRR